MAITKRRGKQVASTAKTADGRPLWGIMAQYQTPGDTIHAAEKVRDAGYKRWDVHAPIPIHGMDDAMGLGPSKVAWITGIAAACGCATAFFIQWYMNKADYAINIAGKPLFAWEQWTPVMFELSILFGGIATIVGMLLMNGLPRLYSPEFTSERFLRSSDDSFFVIVRADDPAFGAQTRALLENAGAIYIEEITEEQS